MPKQYPRSKSTAELRQMLAENPNRIVAEWIGCGIRWITEIRRREGISSPASKKIHDWITIDAELGTSTDAEIAKKHGVKNYRIVSSRRAAMNIPPFEFTKFCVVCGAGFSGTRLRSVCYRDECISEKKHRQELTGTRASRRRKYQSRVGAEVGKLREAFDGDGNRPN